MMFTRPVESKGVPAPTISPASGSILSSQVISIDVVGIAISAEYSFDNSTWVSYTSPFTLSSDATVYARALDADGNYSNVVSNSYTILPYDAEVEYLQSNPSGGTSTERKKGQKISLFTPTIQDEVEVKFMVLEKTGVAFFGARNGQYRFCCTTFSSGTYTAFSMTYNAGPPQRATVTLDTIYTMSAKNGSYTINGSTYSTTQLTSASFGDFLMFCCKNSAGSDAYTKIRCYYVKVYRDGNLLHDFIPVRVGQVGYLYDKESCQLFGNSGTDSFTLGNDIN